jgi:hypothetical protein
MRITIIMVEDQMLINQDILTVLLEVEMQPYQTVMNWKTQEIHEL